MMMVMMMVIRTILKVKNSGDVRDQPGTGLYFLTAQGTGVQLQGTFHAKVTGENNNMLKVF